MIYFASDFHLGLDTTNDSSFDRETRLVKWLDSLGDAEEIFLLGDVFDYWFEYKRVVPKGYFMLFSRLKNLTDRGVVLHILTGNHDMWMFGYLRDSLSATLHYDPITIHRYGKSLHLGHGDGLGPGDSGYKFIKSVFRNRLCQKLFYLIHPDLALGIMKYMSQKSDLLSGSDAKINIQKEWLVQYAEDIIKNKHVDYFIFGHRHKMIDHTLSNNSSRYVGIGDWLSFDSYATLDSAGRLTLRQYNKLL